jgi:hypothetical protein
VVGGGSDTSQNIFNLYAGADGIIHFWDKDARTRLKSALLFLCEVDVV